MGIKPLPPFCGHPVLPTVYDESLSYGEELNKLVWKMNQIIQFANNELTEELKAYIDQRFNDMMITAIYDEPTETITLRLEERANG